MKNPLVGSASFYKSMLDNALLRDPDRGLARFKDTLRPYFAKGVNHVFLWRFLQMFRTYRGQNEFVHWIRRFEIAQKRLLASWSDLLDLSDLPEVGSQAFVAAFTEEQRIHYQQLNTDEEKLNTKRPFENRLLQIERPNIRLNFRCRIVLDFLGTIRPQRTTARALCFINEYSSNRNASIYLSPSETAFLRAFLRFANRCCRPKYRTPKTVDLLHHRQRRDRRR